MNFFDSGHWNSFVGSQCRVVISETRVSSVWSLHTVKKVPHTLKSYPWVSTCTGSDLMFLVQGTSRFSAKALSPNLLFPGTRVLQD